MKIILRELVDITIILLLDSLSNLNNVLRDTVVQTMMF